MADIALTDQPQNVSLQQLNSPAWLRALDPAPTHVVSGPLQPLQALVHNLYTVTIAFASITCGFAACGPSRGCPAFCRGHRILFVPYAAS